MNYFDLTIHQRINAKANKLSMCPTVEKMRGSIFPRMARSKMDMLAYTPGWPFYAIQFKTNAFDLPANYNPHA